METNNKVTICDVIVDYMSNKKDAIATLKELYNSVKDFWTEIKNEKAPAEETIRAAIYKAPKKYNFERVGKGLYFLKGEKTASLLINGDSRQLSEIDNDSIDCIITDHPWSDKKAHKSGNQKGFAEYETFEYTIEDFKAKARVLKDGSFLAEFLPVESATNWEYLTKIKNMAKEAGFQYYCQTIWRKAPEGTVNTGRTCKGIEQIIIFSKGKARRIAPKGKPYMTRNMLSYEIDIPANKGKEKTHQAEKPIPLYEYLIENLTEEQDVCLDTFAGSMNMAKAAVNKNRWGIAYELFKDFVDKAVEKFGCIELFSPDKCIYSENKEDIIEATETFTIETIPKEATDFQIKHLLNILKYKKAFLEKQEIVFLETIKEDYHVYALAINDLFNKINDIGYKNYKKVYFELNLENSNILESLYSNINEEFFAKYNEEYTRSYFQNYKYESEMFIEYAVSKEKIYNYHDIKNEQVLLRYLDFLKKKDYQINIEKTKKVLNEFILTKTKKIA